MPPATRNLPPARHSASASLMSATLRACALVAALSATVGLQPAQAAPAGAESERARIQELLDKVAVGDSAFAQMKSGADWIAAAFYMIPTARLGLIDGEPRKARASDVDGVLATYFGRTLPRRSYGDIRYAHGFYFVGPEFFGPSFDLSPRLAGTTERRGRRLYVTFSLRGSGGDADRFSAEVDLVKPSGTRMVLRSWHGSRGGDGAPSAASFDQSTPYPDEMWEQWKDALAQPGGRVAAVRRQISGGGDVNYCHAGASVLTLAARAGDAGAVRALISAGARPDNPVPGFTPLMAAASGADVGLVTYLLDHGASANGRDDQGNTALMYAAICKFREDRPSYVAAAKALLAHHAAANARNLKGMTALAIAKRRGVPAMVALLEATGTGGSR